MLLEERISITIEFNLENFVFLFLEKYDFLILQQNAKQNFCPVINQSCDLKDSER